MISRPARGVGEGTKLSSVAWARAAWRGGVRTLKGGPLRKAKYLRHVGTSDRSLP